MEKGYLNGECKAYNDKGELVKIWHVKRNLLNGYEANYENGKVVSDHNYKKGKLLPERNLKPKKTSHNDTTGLNKVKSFYKSDKPIKKENTASLNKAESKTQKKIKVKEPKKEKATTSKKSKVDAK